MTFAPGQITGTDLSPNANILGTQIADRTLQFRNFSEDVLKVAETATATITGGSVGNGAQHTFTTSITFSGQYSAIPIILAFSSTGGTAGNLFGGGAFGGSSGPIVPDAWTVGSGGGVSITQAYIFGVTVTKTGATFSMQYLNGDTISHTAANVSLKIYVLEESATA